MIHTVVSLIVYVGQATETENYFNFLLKLFVFQQLGFIFMPFQYMMFRLAHTIAFTAAELSSLISTTTTTSR